MQALGGLGKAGDSARIHSPERSLSPVHLHADQEWILRELHRGDELQARLCLCPALQASFHKRRVHCDVARYDHCHPGGFEKHLLLSHSLSRANRTFPPKSPLMAPVDWEETLNNGEVTSIRIKFCWNQDTVVPETGHRRLLFPWASLVSNSGCWS